MFEETAENQRQASACGKVDAYFMSNEIWKYVVQL